MILGSKLEKICRGGLKIPGAWILRRAGMRGEGQERVTVTVGIILAALSLVCYFGVISTVWDVPALRTSEGLPLAADFANYWSASRLALSGQPASVYNIDVLHGVQQQLLGAQHRYGSGWYYPPGFLLMVLPLGFMPYLPALFVWLTATLILYLLVLARTSAHPIVLTLCLCFPGIFENFVFGQNGFLSGALLGGGLLLLEGWPILAGCLFGLLSYKPTLLILALIALVVGRYWQALISALASAIILAIASAVVFGVQVWTAFLNIMPIPMSHLALGQTNWQITPTFFAATLSAGFGVRAAYLVQGVAMLLAAAGVAWVWRRKTDLAIRGSVLVLGTLLFTPYVMVYDLALLALPLCWLWEAGRIHGRLPGELLLLLLVWLVPILGQVLWGWVNLFYGKLQISPVIILALFCLSLVKARQAMAQDSVSL